jgi:hypothetical protein
MSTKKISWVPMYDDVKNFASTRIRLFYPNQSINTYHSDKYESNIGFDINSDILIIQKRIDNQTLTYVKAFEGFKVFDFDDPVHNNPHFREMMEHIDIVTTDTLGRKEHFDSLGTGKECIVVEDCLDYGVVDILDTPDVYNKIAWFGNYPNAHSIQWMVPHIIETRFELDLITDARNINVQPPIVKTQWGLDTFVGDLRKSNVCALSHLGSDAGVKSNNKMIASIACGVPCIVNSSRSYEELSKEFNLDYAIANDVHSLKNALNILNNIHNRRRYLKDIQPFILNSLSTKVITEKLIKLIESYA